MKQLRSIPKRISTSADLKVPAGDYTLYVLPEDNKWTLIVNKQTGQWGTEYDKAQDLGHVTMILSKSPSPIERFQITLAVKGRQTGPSPNGLGHDCSDGRLFGPLVRDLRNRSSWNEESAFIRVDPPPYT